MKYGTCFGRFSLKIAVQNIVQEIPTKTSATELILSIVISFQYVLSHK